MKVGSLAVAVDSQSLEVNAVQCEYDNLHEAMGVARKALESLPETPISAVGINIRYKLDALPAKTVDRLRCDLDSELAALDYVRVENTISKNVEFNAGVISLILSWDNSGHATLVVNFNRTTQEHSEAIEWLALPIEELRTNAHNIAVRALGIPESELNNEG